MQVGEGVLDYLRAGCSSQEEGSFGVLGGLGDFFVEGAFAACIAGFTETISFDNHCLNGTNCLHLAQHFEVVVVELGGGVGFVIETFFCYRNR